MSFTVSEIVMMGRTAAINRWSRPSTADRRIVERAMVYTDVADMKSRPFSDLSGGEKQRAIIAMVLAQEPQTILLDEATSHLDINHRLEVMQIVERLNREQGTTILMVSHDLNLSAEFCRRLLLLDHGSVVADGTPTDVLTEELLSRVYHCDIRVQRNPANGSVSVVPAPRLTPGCSGKGIRIHVVAGGGCGEEVLRRLCLNEYTITCGVLNQGDSDADVAAALGVETALEKPFSPVGQEALTTAKKMVSQADAVIVCGVPFGPGNVVNLDLVEQALTAKKKVFIMDGVSDRDYTPNRDANRKANLLLSAGAASWRTITDLFGALPHASDRSIQT
jgi:iron complex transport system ATP-binding protein